MEEPQTGWKLANVGRYLEVAQSYRDDSADYSYPVLVLARGRYDDVAMVMLSTDGMGRFGPPDVESLVLLRNPEFAGEDEELAAVVAAAGGCLQLATRFDDRHAHSVVRGAWMMLAWRAHKVFRVIDAAAAQAAARPARVVADPCAPDYGRWPAPAVQWVSVAPAVAWRLRLFLPAGCRGAGGPKLRDAVAAFDWPPLGAQEQSLTKALAVAALLCRMGWVDAPLPELPSLARLPEAVMSVVGIHHERVYRLDPDGCWRPLFHDFGYSGDRVRLLEIERAAAHARMADRRVSEKGVIGMTS